MRNSINFLVKRLVLGVILLLALSATTVYAGAPSEIHIKPDGKFYATNASVTQKAGKGNLFSRITWGDAYVRVTVLAHDDTQGPWRDSECK